MSVAPNDPRWKLAHEDDDDPRGPYSKWPKLTGPKLRNRVTDFLSDHHEADLTEVLDVLGDDLSKEGWKFDPEEVKRVFRRR